MGTQSPHPNATAMHAAVSRWIEEAQAKPNTAELLWSKVEQLEGYSRMLSSDGPVPPALEGVGAFDLTCAICKLTGAATTAERRVDLKVAA